MLGRPLKDIVDLLFAEDDRQHAILETVVVEDIREAWRYDHADSPILECPRRMLTAGATTKVTTCDEHTRTLSFGAIQFEVFDHRTIFVAGPVPKQKFAE